MLRIATALTVLSTAIVARATGAWAQVLDPTDGAFTDTLSDGGSWMTTYGIPAIFALALIGLIVGLALKYLRKGRTTV